MTDVVKTAAAALMLTDLDRVSATVRRLEGDLNALRYRLGLVERWIEEHLEPPVTPRSEPDMGRAAAIGAELADSRAVARGAKESARGLRRALDPSDDTGAHQLPAKEQR